VVKKKSKSKNIEKKKEKIEKPSKKKFLDYNYKLILNNDTLKYIIPVILVFLVLFISYDIRSGPITLDGLDKRIEANTYSQIQNMITQNIDQQYPDLNQVYKQELIQKEYQKVLDTGEYELNNQSIIVSDIVTQNSQNVKNQFKAENGQTYLNAIDPYYFLGISTNYYKNGHLGDTTIIDKNGKEIPFISYRLAPIGSKTSDNEEFHVWLESKLFKLNNIDDSSSIGEKTKAIFLIPVIFSMLSGVLIFFILRLFSNDLVAFLGSLLLVSIGTFVSRTVAGFVDTDAYNVFFPLLIVLVLLYSYLSKDLIKSSFFAVLAGLFQAMFLWAWGSGWFLFVFVFGALIGYTGYILTIAFLNRKLEKNIISSLKNELYTLVSFVVSSAIFSYMINGTNIFYSSYEGIFGSISRIAGISQTNIWPNVLSSVAELNPASFTQVISSVGGKIVFFIALMGILFLTLDFKIKNESLRLYIKALIVVSIIWFYLFIYKNFLIKLTANSSLLFLFLLFLPVGVGLIVSLFEKNTSEKIFLTILISIWVSGTIYMSLNGVRFILLLAPAFAISFGLGLYYIAKYINSSIQSEFKISSSGIKSQVGGYVVVLILFLVLFLPIYSNAQNISNNTLPNFDDAWYSSMYKIRDNSSENAIITSWWDFGHFFATVAQRGVTFDGGTQATPRSHWVGRLLMENDEEKSQDILKMLVCGGNEAHNTMLSYTNGSNADAVKINKIIYETLGKNSIETREILRNNKYYEYTDEQIDKIMSYLSCEAPPENFLITSADMVGKAGVWAHWGSWDFTKKYVYDNYKKLSVEQIAQDIDENKTLIQSYIDQLNEIDTRSSAEDIKREDLVNQWFAPYPSYIPIQGKYQYQCKPQNTSLICQNGIIINTKTFKLTTAPNLQGKVSFSRLLFPGQNNTLVQVPQEENGNVDVLLIPNKNSYSVMLMQYPLGGSLFTKLFYLNGYGTSKFDKFNDVTTATGQRVITWKTKWD